MQFDLKPIKGYRLRLASKLLDVDIPLLMDEEVSLQIEAKVVEVVMKVNRNTGQLVRTHVLEVDTISVKGADK